MTSEDLKVSFDYAKLRDSLSQADRYSIILELERLNAQLGRISTYVAVMQEVLRDTDEEYGDEEEDIGHEGSND